jgi:serine/threonine protein kinase
MPSPRAPLAPGTRLGPYEIVGALGAGGMGEVYRARDTRLGRDVAIKVLGGGFHDHPEYLARFEREARAVAELSHPNIATLHDVGRDGEIEYLVLELVEGETLAVRLRKGPLPIEVVCRLGAQVANALAAAHARGIVHRDLKPSNIMVTGTGAKVLDFGLARRFEAASGDSAGAEISRDLTATGTIMGTMPYMSPEQIEGGAADARTDVFSLGLVLWEMATGRRAFAASTDPALIAAILGVDPPPIGSLRPGTPPALDRLESAFARTRFRGGNRHATRRSRWKALPVTAPRARRPADRGVAYGCSGPRCRPPRSPSFSGHGRRRHVPSPPRRMPRASVSRSSRPMVGASRTTPKRITWPCHRMARASRTRRTTPPAFASGSVSWARWWPGRCAGRRARWGTGGPRTDGRSRSSWTAVSSGSTCRTAHP